MEEIVSNSHKYREEQKKKAESENKNLQKVVTGSVHQRKKSELSKVASIFLPEDVSSVKSFILTDVIVPAAKKLVSDIVDAILYPDGGRDRKRSTPGSKVSYRAYYDRERDRRDRSSYPRSDYDLDEYVIETRGEAEDVLSRMDEILSRYPTVSVADFYDLIGVSCDYTANKYGWTDIRNATIARVREGYVIRFPRPMPLN